MSTTSHSFQHAPDKICRQETDSSSIRLQGKDIAEQGGGKVLQALLKFWSAKRRATQGYAPQLHLIAGQRPCLVTEHIFHHTKILHHVSVPGFCKLATCLMLHLSVKINVQPLQQSQCLARLQMAQR